MSKILKEYSKAAEQYDTRHADKCYKWESRELIRLIDDFKKTKGKDLLDVGCGTGGHLYYLQDVFNCTGMDLHKEMIELAKKKLKKKVILMKEDMTTFNLNKQFDIIICLYSVINYSKDYAEFRKTIRNFYNHLKKGGVCIIEPYWTKKIYKNFKGKEKAEDLLMNEISKWSRIMQKEGFKVKYFYRGLHQSAKGVYVLTK